MASYQLFHFHFPRVSYGALISTWIFYGYFVFHFLASLYVNFNGALISCGVLIISFSSAMVCRPYGELITYGGANYLDISFIVYFIDYFIF